MRRYALIQRDDMKSSKKEMEFSPSYSHLPPREIFVYDQEEPDTPFEAAATPAHENLTTKTTDITEPDIPLAPRTKGCCDKKFTFDQVSTPSQRRDGRDATEDKNDDNEKGEETQTRDTYLHESMECSQEKRSALSDERWKDPQRESKVFFDVADSIPSDEERALAAANAAQFDQPETEGPVGEEDNMNSATGIGKEHESSESKGTQEEATHSARDRIIGEKVEEEGTIDRKGEEENISYMKLNNKASDGKCEHKGDLNPIEEGALTQTSREGPWDSSIMPAPSDEMQNQVTLKTKTDEAPSTPLRDDVCLQLESFCLTTLFPS